MRRWFGLPLALMLAIPAAAQIPPEIQSLIDEGAFGEARAELSIAAELSSDGESRRALLFEAERLRRVAMDFASTEEELLDALKESIPDVTADDLAHWREQGVLQSQMIDGTRYYFIREARNLFRRSSEARERRGDEDSSRLQSSDDGEARDLEAHINEVIEQSASSETGICCPVRRRVHVTVTVNPGEVPEGEMVRCWLLYPREETHQTDVQTIQSTPETHLIAPPDAPQRTIYLEQPAAASPEGTKFEAVYEYTAWASHRRIDPDAIRPYERGGEDYAEYTSERPPHVVFTPEIRALAEEIVGDETNPYLKAQRIFTWMNDNVRWISEREYSTILNISDLCRERQAGDCGVQSLLFITLCRCVDVPARWESGWYCQPGYGSMHDWARFYVEPYGWLWADPSKGYYSSFASDEAQHFYFGNIDHFRLVANGDYSRPLDPTKEHFRSETVDFQRGEVEWSGGNLYFDQWDYDLEFEDLPLLSAEEAD